MGPTDLLTRHGWLLGRGQRRAEEHGETGREPRQKSCGTVALGAHVRQSRNNGMRRTNKQAGLLSSEYAGSR